ncbi:MAG: phosphonate ABC transporter, permease protein PhnE [Armatimonadota bacterium]|nr:phosphonate ABC transporter, permease protein PhnE [Armatimonadota bacterium]
MSRDKTRSAVIAGVLAVVPGLGHFYCSEWQRGIVLMLGLPAQAAILYGVGLIWLALPLVLVWIWNICDAVCLASGGKCSAALAVLLLLAINLAAAWQVTQVHIPKLEPEQRNVIRQILVGLAKPDVAERRTREQTAVAKYLVPGIGAPSVLTPVKREPGEPVLKVSPVKAQKGDRLTVIGSGFARNAPTKLVLLGADEVVVAETKTDSSGRLNVSFRNPRYIPGVYFVQARVSAPVRGWQLSETLKEAAPRMVETIYLALIGTALSLVVALPLSFLGARNLMSGTPVLRAVYALVRTIFTVLRSVEVLIFAVIAVAAVGIGPFAGVLALAIHGIGALGKLYSEAIESIEHGPIEAIRSTGANEIQVVAYAVVPQVVPQFIAFTLYRWDINVRMATVIGLVGGGGIGYQLIQYMNLLQWRQAATAIWLIAGVVMIMDYASAVIRERIG